MTSRSLSFFSLFAAGYLAVGMATTSLAAEQTVKVDPSKSLLTWTGKKVTGQHSGTLKLKDGTVKMTDGKLTGGTFAIDMTSIAVTDIEDPKNNKKLTDHLHSDDFFSAEKFPTGTFTITKAEPITGAAAGQPNYTVTGNLEFKGISHEVTFPATVTVEGDRARATGTATLDRTKWNVKYGSGKFFAGLGDKLIYDEFDVGLDVTGALG